MNVRSLSAIGSRITLNAAIKIAITTFAVTALFQTSAALLQSADKAAVQPIPIDQLASTVRREALIYQLVDLEESAGIATDPEHARKVLDVLLEESKQIKISENPRTMDVLAYFKEVGRLVGKYFYYETSTTLTGGIRSQALDCDLRSYLYLAIAKRAGLEISLIFGPRHAFIGWNGNDGQMDIYWETTSQFGHAVDLSESFYEFSNDGLDYRFTTEEEAEDLYAATVQALVIEKGRSDEALERLSNLAGKYPTSTTIQAMNLYGIAANGTADDDDLKAAAQSILALNPSSSTSVGANRELMERLAAKGEVGSIRQHFNNIPISHRVPSDYKILGAVEQDWQQIAGKLVIGWASEPFFRAMAAVGQKADWVLFQLYFSSILLSATLWIFMPLLRSNKKTKTKQATPMGGAWIHTAR